MSVVRLACCLFFFWLLCGLSASAAARPPLLIVLLPGTSLRDWEEADAPNLHRLMAMGSLAVTNTRTARLPNDHARETPESACLTLGAGSRAAGGPMAFQPSGASVPGLAVSAGALYARRLGRVPPPGSEVDMDWPRLLQQNTGRGYDIHLGNLADALVRQGVTVRAGGGPWSRLVAADGDGVVVPAASLTLTQNECLVWDSGTALPQADTAIGAAAAQVRRWHGRLLILSPFVSDADYAQGRRLAPILEWGEGVPAGLLRSPSTRRAGLVTDTDFAPTVALYFGQRTFPALPFGSPISAEPSLKAPAAVLRLETQAYRQASAMRVLPYMAVALAVWIALGTWGALAGRQVGFWSLPPALLLVILALAGTPGQVCLGLAALPPAWLLSRRFGAARVLTGTLAALALALLGDMLTGNRLMHSGLLGYSAVEGARYYGIGNEAAGVLVGSLLVLARRGWPAGGGPRIRATRFTLLGGLAAVALLLGMPTLGAKAGGLLVALLAFGTFGLFALGVRWSARTVAIFAGVVLLGMVCMAFGDALFSHGHSSHIGGAVARIRQGGAGQAGDIIGRKLATEGRLAYHSAWAVLLWTGLVCLLVLWRSHGPAPSRNERALRQAGVAAVIACLALNDAGVVAAALCLVPLWCEAAAGVSRTPPEARRLPGAEGIA